jgi:hypothetical protein
MMNNTMDNQSTIEQTVMRRVRIIRILRPIVSMGTLAVLVFVLALWGIGREVWVARVLQNAPTNITGLFNFSVAAFIHTRFVVQVLALLSLAALITLARETARTLSSIFIPIHV